LRHGAGCGRFGTADAASSPVHDERGKCFRKTRGSRMLSNWKWKNPSSFLSIRTLGVCVSGAQFLETSARHPETIARQTLGYALSRFLRRRAKCK
jgi:hypothetical protein